MQQVTLPPWVRVPGVMWVVLLVGLGIFAYHNVSDPTLFQLIAGGIFIAMRLLVNNDKALEQAAGEGQSLLDYIFRQPKSTVVPPTVAGTGMRSSRVELEAVEPVPISTMSEPPKKWLSVLFG